MEAPLYRAWTKGTTAESGSPRYSPNWVAARRAWFKVFPDRVECGDWVIPKEVVKDAVLFETRQWFIPVSVLAVSTEQKAWQFGFNPWVRVAEHLPFPVKRERVRLKYSALSLAIRAALVAYVVYWLFDKWRA